MMFDTTGLPVTSEARSLEVRRPLTLLLDADDTLWENNIYFLEVTEHFLEALAEMRVDRDEARRLLSETERKNIPILGYGSRAFAHSLLETYETLAGSPDPVISERLRSLAHAIFDRDTVEIRVGAREALEALREHHRLVLVTKGDREEQLRKVERSGLAGYFARVEVVAEKDAATYRHLVEDLGADPATTWMIGNSPRSDINPALEAGINAILVPHPSTWELELEEVGEPSQRFVVVDAIGDLIALFVPATDDQAGPHGTATPGTADSG